MPEDQGGGHKFEWLREQAEQLIKEHQDQASWQDSEMVDVIHELKVSQAELEIQNQELRRAQQENAQLQQEYQDLYEFAPFGYLTLNPKGIITRANLTGVSLLERERRILLKSSFTVFIASEWVNQYQSAKHKAIKTGEKQSVELQLQTGTQELKWVLVDIDAEKEGQQSFSQLRMVLKDITERKQAEERLRESEKWFRAIVEGSPDAVFVQTEKRFAYLSTQALRLFGAKDESDLLGQSVFDRFHPDFHDLVLERIRKLNEQRQPVMDRLEQKYVRLDGSEVWVETTAQPISYHGKNGALVFVRDITERKRSEKILQARLRLMEYSLTHSLEEVLTATIDEVESLTDSRIGFYHFLLSDQRTISLQRWSTRTNTEVCFAKSKGMHYDLDEAGVWADCIRKAEPVIHNDYSSLAHRKGTPQGHPYIVRELVVPVYRGDNIKAILGVGNKPGNYTNADVEAVSLLANLAWDITERKQMEEKLQRMSLHDSLTGLYNRNFFEEEMERLSDGRHNPLGIIVCDVDGLKFINDTLGHQSGDQVLISVAGILRQCFRSSEIIARLGGDEFAVLLTDTDPEVVEMMLQRLRQTVLDYNNSGPEIPLSLSLGYALNEGETTDMHALFREADSRMYRDKMQHEGSARSAILQVLSASMQARDFDTEGHCDRLQELAISLARSLDFSQDLVNDISLLARFHDLGKVGTPDNILFKPGSLSDEEWRQMRQHCEIGHRIASSVPDLEPIADQILKHHEWWDGRGYPLGLSGEDIPLPCRILAIADAYDAITSDRPYHKAMTREEAIAELRRFAGTQFDPELVEQFIQILEQHDS
ncbi:MAG: diguanylate cyclase [Desulfovermiculus sp.]